jgi:hypothetical protein
LLSVAAVMAVSAGERAGSCMIEVPRIRELVCEPTQASCETASLPQSSAVQSEW